MNKLELSGFINLINKIKESEETIEYREVNEKKLVDAFIKD